MNWKDFLVDSRRHNRIRSPKNFQKFRHLEDGCRYYFLQNLPKIRAIENVDSFISVLSPGLLYFIRKIHFNIIL